MPDNARLGEPAGVEAEFRRVEVSKGDPGTLRTDVLVNVMRGTDVALLVSQARSGQDAAVEGLDRDVVVRIPEGEAVRLYRSPPVPPMEHLPGAAREGDAAGEVARPVGKLAEAVLHGVIAGVEERVQAVGIGPNGVGGVHRFAEGGQDVIAQPEVAVKVVLVGLASYQLPVLCELALGGNGEICSGNHRS
jgi:hypothetical protein